MVRRDSTEAELDALHQVCERLAGFDGRVSLEWLDGALTALMAGPSVPDGPQAVLEPLLGDAWARTFADPADEAQALAPLEARWRVLRSQLDPDALVEDYELLRLAPALLAPVEGEPADDGFLMGADWAAGFLQVVQDPAWGWGNVAIDEGYEQALAAVQALRAPAPTDARTDGGKDAIEEAGRESRKGAGTGADKGADADAAVATTREDLIDAAAFAAQDLRLWWIEHAPRTAPRRAEATPGRNDPCPCGSGKKYKKCHGAA